MADALPITLGEEAEQGHAVFARLLPLLQKCSRVRPNPNGTGLAGSLYTPAPGWVTACSPMGDPTRLPHATPGFYLPTSSQKGRDQIPPPSTLLFAASLSHCFFLCLPQVSPHLTRQAHAFSASTLWFLWPGNPRSTPHTEDKGGFAACRDPILERLE